MPKKKRQTFSPEFKREAVRLLNRGDKEIAQLARELGVRRNQLYKWKAECDSRGESAFPGSGKKLKQGGQAGSGLVIQLAQLNPNGTWRQEHIIKTEIK